MIKISCNCQESFRISEQNIITKETVTCPNCGQIMSQDILNSLIEYSKAKLESESHLTKAIELAKEKPQEGMLWGGKKNWSFAIENLSV